MFYVIKELTVLDVINRFFYIYTIMQVYYQRTAFVVIVFELRIVLKRR